MSENVHVAIPKDLYDKVANKVSMFNDEFKSVEEYIIFVLTEVLKDEEEQGYTKEEEEEIKNRLKNLGYI